MRFSEKDMGTAGSPRHMYGREIRAKRNELGLTLTATAAVLGYSKAALSRYETGESPIPDDLPRKLDMAFGAHGMFTRLYQMVEHDQFPDRYRAFMAIAAEALAILEYACATVPGLLQTPAYARALFKEFEPGASDAEIERRVAARVSRQKIFRRAEPPRYGAILDEAVIRRPIGERSVMCAQLEALLPRVNTPYGTLQVLPFSSGAHAALGGSFTLLTPPDSDPVAYLEGSHNGQLREDPDTVEERQQTYDRLRGYACSPQESARMIRAAIKELERCEQPPTRTSRPGARARTATATKGTAWKLRAASRGTSRSVTAKTLP